MRPAAPRQQPNGGQRWRWQGAAQLGEMLAVEVFYDGECPFCCRAAAWWRRLDWFRLLRFCSFREFTAADLPAPAAQLEARLHSRRLGRTTAAVNGIDSVLQLSLRTPLLLPLTPVLWVLTRVNLGNAAYDMVAAHRYQLLSSACARRSPQGGLCRASGGASGGPCAARVPASDRQPDASPLSRQSGK